MFSCSNEVTHWLWLININCLIKASVVPILTKLQSSLPFHYLWLRISMLRTGERKPQRTHIYMLLCYCGPLNSRWAKWWTQVCPGLQPSLFPLCQCWLCQAGRAREPALLSPLRAVSVWGGEGLAGWSVKHGLQRSACAVSAPRQVSAVSKPLAALAEEI